MKTQYLAIILLVLPFITENPSHEDAPCSTDSGGNAIFSRGAPASTPEILDSHGKAIYGPITVGQQIQVSSVVNNGQNCVQPFAYLVQIQDLNGVTVSLSWINGTLSARQSLTPAQSWTPTGPGTYTAQIFTWQSIDNPNALAPPLSAAISVQPNSNLTQPSQVVSRVPSKFTSAIPTTVQVVMSPGVGANQNCVAATNCFDPSRVTIQPGDTVTWINNDNVSHTTTSGGPSNNQTGVDRDSGIVRPGGSYSLKFYDYFAGTFDYFCKVHPWMRGKVISTEVFESPAKQFKSGISPKGVKCDQGLALVIKSTSNAPACVKPQIAQKLVERGWGITLNSSLTSLNNSSCKHPTFVNATLFVTFDYPPNIPDTKVNLTSDILDKYPILKRAIDHERNIEANFSYPYPFLSNITGNEADGILSVWNSSSILEPAESKITDNYVTRAFYLMASAYGGDWFVKITETHKC